MGSLESNNLQGQCQFILTASKSKSMETNSLSPAMKSVKYARRRSIIKDFQSGIVHNASTYPPMNACDSGYEADLDSDTDLDDEIPFAARKAAKYLRLFPRLSYSPRTKCVNSNEKALVRHIYNKCWHLKCAQ